MSLGWVAVLLVVYSLALLVLLEWRDALRRVRSRSVVSHTYGGGRRVRGALWRVRLWLDDCAAAWFLLCWGAWMVKHQHPMTQPEKPTSQKGREGASKLSRGVQEGGKS